MTSGPAGAGARPSIWTGDGLRREAFFFQSGEHSLYGSIHVAAAPSRPYGMIICPSWGIEADRAHNWVQWLALKMAELGGLGVTFHYPGYGDSQGRLESVGIEDLCSGAVDAAAEATRRYPGFTFLVAGLRLGASVAALASRRLQAEGLLLLQPSLDPSAYFADLARNAERSKLGGGTSEFAFGYPLPRRIVSAGPEASAAVDAALVAFEGRGAVVRYASRAPGPAPPGFEEITVPGSWRFAPRDISSLARAAAEWTDEVTGAAAPPSAESTTAASGDRTARARARRTAAGEDSYREHPTILATSAGPVGAIITEPRRPRGVGMIFLTGGGPRAGGDPRAGVNATWVRMARHVAGLGITVLRPDHPGAGESYLARGKQGSSQHVDVLEEVVAWFRETSRPDELLLAGICYGGRMTLRLAARQQFAGVGLIVPHLEPTPSSNRWLDRGRALVGRPGGGDVDPGIEAAIGGALARTPVWALVGEQEDRDLVQLKQRVPGAERLEIEVAPHPMVHSLFSAAIQQEVTQRVIDWAQRVVAPELTERPS